MVKEDKMDNFSIITDPFCNFSYVSIILIVDDTNENFLTLNWQEGIGKKGGRRILWHGLKKNVVVNSDFGHDDVVLNGDVIIHDDYVENVSKKEIVWQVFLNRLVNLKTYAIISSFTTFMVKDVEKDTKREVRCIRNDLDVSLFYVDVVGNFSSTDLILEIMV